MKAKLLTIISLLLFTVCTKVYAQESNNFISIIVYGKGKTIEEATQVGLKSAVLKTLGSFINAKSETFNIKSISDQFASLSSGNIESFDILNQSQLTDGNWTVILKVSILPDKLVTSLQSKGIVAELKGGLIGSKGKELLLNEEGEFAVIYDLVGQLHEPMQNAFDYSIKRGDPKSLDSENKNWEIPLEVTATANHNLEVSLNTLVKTLQILSPTKQEFTSCHELGKDFFDFFLEIKGEKFEFYLRNRKSKDVLYTLLCQWKFFIKGFTVDNGIEKFESSIFKANFHNDFDNYRKYNWSRGTYYYESPFLQSEYKGVEFIHFPSVGDIVAIFKYSDEKDFEQIERIKGYNVKSNGVQSSFKEGGIVLLEPINKYFIGLKHDVEGVIHVVTDNSPAEVAGLSVGDKILSVEGLPFSTEQLQEVANIGKKFTMEVLVNGKMRNIKIIPYFFQRKGLVVSLMDLGDLSFNEGKKQCEDLVLNGYEDWRLPTKEELDYMYLIEHSNSPLRMVVNREVNEVFWSFNIDDHGIYANSLKDSSRKLADEESKYRVRAVRTY